MPLCPAPSPPRELLIRYDERTRRSAFIAQPVSDIESRGCNLEELNAREVQQAGNFVGSQSVVSVRVSHG